MSKYTNLLPAPSGINHNLSSVGNNFMFSVLGSPCHTYSKDCQDPTNQKFLTRVKWGADVGPFKVSGFDLAVDSLKEVMRDIKHEQNELYHQLSSFGMLCCRFVRKSNSAVSNHSWGTAIDIKIDGVVDRVGNNKVQLGLALIAPIFHRHGWYWGAGFPREDGMHFEVSKQKMMQWYDQNLLFENRIIQTHSTVSFGDRSEDVLTLQTKLNQFGYNLYTDGIFGSGTLGAVIDFQASHGLEPDGIVGRRTWDALNSL